MSVVTDSVFIDLLLVLIPIVYLVYWYLTNNDDYWDKRGVPNVKRGFIMDSLIGKKSQGETTIDLYNTFHGKRFAGFLNLKQPVLMIEDLELIHKILVKDFTHFQDRGQPATKKDILSLNLFSLRGQMWRALRYKLTPTFTTGKLKNMFEQISKSGDSMMQKLEELSEPNAEIESKLFLFEYTLDVISSCAFGVQFKPNSPDFNNFKSSVSKIFKPNIFVFFRFIMILLLPKLADILDVRTFSKELAEYFTDLTKSNLKYRKDKNIQRNDYFQMLITLQEQEESGKDMGISALDATEEDSVVNQMEYTAHDNQSPTSNIKLFTDEVICANTFIFLTAGSESTAGTINHTLFELSRNPAVQQKLQQEVDSVLAKHGEWCYGAVKDMTYLDQVVQEAQRLYPIIPLLLRECVEPYKIPDSNLVIEKGVHIGIPVWGLHKDPQYYPEPDKFKPERFEGNNFKPNSAYLPYGDGPRICIAMRFAVMEVKTCVAKIMSQYSVKLGNKTQLPIKFDPRGFVPSIKGGIWLSFEKRSVKSI